MHEDLINRNASSFNYLLNNVESIPYNDTQQIDVFDDNIFSYVEKKSWGFYDVIISKTVFKTDTVLKVAMIGKVNTNTIARNLALYVTDYDNPLKLSGRTQILGHIKVPNGRTEQAYINGNSGNHITLKGQASSSNNKLPKINNVSSIDFSDYDFIPLKDIDKKSIIVNGFDKKGKVIDLNEITRLDHVVIKGHVVLISNNELYIDKTAQLNDVLVVAPKVNILSGFKGNIQIIAKEVVEINENVSLFYPSSIYVKNDLDSISVTIHKNAKLIGGVVIDGDTYNGSLKHILKIKEDATVVGNIYCFGRLQLEGDVIGSVYSDRFSLKTASSNYENVILNGSINRDSLPKNFVELPLFKGEINNEKYAIIKEF